MPHATVPSPGLQALILCGPGVSLNTFTSNPKELSKALIPIANRPMVWYPLDWCHRMGVSDITLITPPECAPALESALATYPALTSLPSPKPNVVVPDGLETTTGTGELLRLPEVQKCITSDFVVLPCDLISELDGTRIIQQWMTLNPAGNSATKDIRKGGLTVFYSAAGWEDISHKKDETDFLATSPLAPAAVPPPVASLRSNIEELVWVMPTDTLNDKLEENASHLRIRHSLLDAHPRVKLRRKHRDAHIYVFPKWVKDFVAKNETFDAISEDVVGWWAKAGWQNGLASKLSLDQILVKKRPMSESFEESYEEKEIDPLDSSSTKNNMQSGELASKFASRVSISNQEASSPLSVPQLLAYVQPAPTASVPQPLLRRVDTSQQLLSVSLYIAKQQAGHILLPEHRIHPSASVGMQCRIAQEDILIAENVKIGIRANIKETIIGQNCEIGNNVRLNKCLLMDGVHVGDGVQLTGCIVGRRAKIQGTKPAEQPSTPTDGQSQGDGAAPKAKGKKKVQDDDDERTRLTECEVAPHFVVESGTEAKGEKLMAFDTEGMDEGETDED